MRETQLPPNGAKCGRLWAAKGPPPIVKSMHASLSSTVRPAAVAPAAQHTVGNGAFRVWIGSSLGLP
jgi:hypothetical protein